VYAVASGLQAGEAVAANGVFRIDAAAQLQGKTAMMNPPTANTQEPGKLVVHEADTTYDVPEAFRQQLQAVYVAYLPLKDALVQTNGAAARQQAEALMAALKAVNGQPIKGAAAGAWQQDVAVLLGSTTSMLQQTDVANIRALLQPLSDQLYHTLVKFQVATGAYRQYCPMAFDYTGGYWLSDVEDIMNPYFGDEMLTCGNVEEQLK